MINPYAIPSLFAGIFCGLIGSYVFYKNPKSGLNRTAALLAFAVSIWGIAEFMHRITPDPTSQMWYRISGFGWCFVSSIVLHFSLIFAKKEEILKNKLVYLPLYAPAFVFLYLSWATDLIFKMQSVEMPWGYSNPPGNLAWTYTIYVLAFVVLAIYLCSQVYKRSSVSVERKQGLIITVAFLIPLVIGSSTGLILPMMNVQVVELAAISCIASAIVIAYAIIIYQLFVVPPISRFFIPMPEASLSTKPKYKLEPGRSYSIKEKEPKRSAEMFRDAVSHGIPGVWVTSKLPGKLEHRFVLAKTFILSMIAERIEGEVTVDPDKLGRARGILFSYLSRTPRAVVLIDCFYELMITNGFKKSLGFLEELGQKCLERGANLIVTFDPGKFTKSCVADIDRTLG